MQAFSPAAAWVIGHKYTEGFTRLVCIGLIVAGILGLKLVTK
jgi:multidrug transporter EmrE-like cation transporter